MAGDKFNFIFPQHLSAVEIQIKRDRDEAVTDLTIHIHNLTAVPFPEQRDVSLAKKLSKKESR